MKALKSDLELLPPQGSGFVEECPAEGPTADPDAKKKKKKKEARKEAPRGRSPRDGGTEYRDVIAYFEQLRTRLAHRGTDAHILRAIERILDSERRALVSQMSALEHQIKGLQNGATGGTGDAPPALQRDVSTATDLYRLLRLRDALVREETNGGPRNTGHLDARIDALCASMGGPAPVPPKASGEVMSSAFRSALEDIKARLPASISEVSSYLNHFPESLPIYHQVEILQELALYFHSKYMWEAIDSYAQCCCDAASRRLAGPTGLLQILREHSQRPGNALQHYLNAVAQVCLHEPQNQDTLAGALPDILEHLRTTHNQTTQEQALRAVSAIVNGNRTALRAVQTPHL